MKHLQMVSIVCFLFLSLAWAQDQFNLSGTIKNQADFSVFGMICELKDAGLRDTSDSSGAFTVTGPTTAIAHKIRENTPTPRFKGSQLIIPVISDAQPVSVEVYNMKGSKVATIFNKTLTRGDHTLPFADRITTYGQSVLVAVIKRGSDMSRFRVVKAGNQHVMFQEMSGSASNSMSAVTAASNPMQVLDSMRFIRCITVEDVDERFVEFTIPIENLVDEFEVTLDLIPYEAVEYGKTQNLRGPEEVGVELEEANIYPYDGYRYWGTSAWCSEFYSYILRIGGCPLGDDEGSATRPHWLVTGWTGLIRWYEDNAQFIYKDQIDAENYRPNPGDYIQMAEHSTMVRYVADNDDVYCVGGNESNRVQLRNRGNYKTFSSLNGYGRRSGITGNSFQSVK